MRMKSVVRKYIPGVLWQNPVIGFGLKMLDPVDYAIRVTRQLAHLPRYSIRVRSNGITGQFGGRSFFKYGQVLSQLLQNYACVTKSSKVLEIGCGCGRTAIALASFLNDGQYTGMDIDRISLDANKKNHLLLKHKFTFDLLDVQNNEYNPRGTRSAEEYVFPYGAEEFDVIFLVSVFTHMLTPDVTNYISEISRMLKPKGVCMITTFLMDLGTENPGLSFPYSQEEHHYYHLAMPEVAVGYYLRFYQERFARHNMKLWHDPLWGSWRNKAEVISSSGFSQDALFFRKEVNSVRSSEIGG